MFNLGNNYIENKDDHDFANPRRGTCPKCNKQLVRRGNEQDGYYFIHCRRVWK